MDISKSVRKAVELGTLRSQISAVEEMLKVADDQLSGDLTTQMVRNVMATAKEEYLAKVQQWADQNRKEK